MKNLRDYQVNEPLPSKGWYPSELDIRLYAEAANDFNPIHLDEAYARSAGFDGVIAHGMLTMAQMGVMLTDWISEEGTLKSYEVRFEKIVRVGERIVFSGLIKDILSNALICDLTATNAKGEKVLSGSAMVVLTTAKVAMVG